MLRVEVRNRVRNLRRFRLSNSLDVLELIPAVLREIGQRAERGQRRTMLEQRLLDPNRMSSSVMDTPRQASSATGSLETALAFVFFC